MTKKTAFGKAKKSNKESVNHEAIGHLLKMLALALKRIPKTDKSITVRRLHAALAMFKELRKQQEMVQMLNQAFGITPPKNV